MRRKTIVVLLIGLVLALARFADAQQQTKVTKIGWLGARSASAPAREVFARELRALGYVEGKNIAFEYHTRRVNLTGSPPWLTSWSVSKLTYSSRPRRLLP